MNQELISGLEQIQEELLKLKNASQIIADAKDSVTKIAESSNLVIEKFQNLSTQIDTAVGEEKAALTLFKEGLDAEIKTIGFSEIKTVIDKIDNQTDSLGKSLSKFKEIIDKINSRTESQNSGFSKISNIVTQINEISTTIVKIDAQTANLGGDISKTQTTADRIDAQTANLGGDISKTQTTADRIDKQTVNLGGDISKIQTTADRIDLLFIDNQ